jgi:hypothetical protein
MGSSSSPEGFAPPPPPSPSLAGAPSPAPLRRGARIRSRFFQGGIGPLAAFRDGIRRVNSAPLLVCGMFAVTVLVSLPLSVALGGMIEDHLGRSLAADGASTGTDYDWWQEFSAQATGLGKTFVPTIVGFGAVLHNVSQLLDNQRLAVTIAGATCAWLVIWSFLSGGVIDRLARARPTRSAGFFAACGTHFWRFARLGLIATLVYYVLFAGVHAWLFDSVYPRLTRNLTVERTAFAIRLGCYAVFGLLLVLANLVFDYGRIRIVVEDRHSAVGALIAGSRFVRRNQGTLWLYALNGGAFLVLVLAYALLSPGAPRSGVRMWLTLGVGQFYVFLRHYLKLVFYASETSFFQGAVAHASYTAAPALVWPESPAAEAVLNADSIAP